jgi:hypothetical protein
MKKLINWISGFFSSESNNSSKRLVGIVGAGFLYYTLYSNSKSEAHIEPSESLVWATTALIMVSLGLTTIESVTGLIKGIKKDKKEE